LGRRRGRVARRRVREDGEGTMTPQEQQRHEPKVRAQPSGWERRLFAGYERAESLIMSIVALVLIALAVIALVDTVVQIATPLLARERDYTEGSTRRSW